MTNQVIPDAAVEAAARAAYGAADNYGLTHWEDLSESRRGPYERIARAALEAAAPHMLAAKAEAWDEGESSGQDNSAAYQTGGEVARNPYR
jgi:hypothetical protein